MTSSEHRTRRDLDRALRQLLEQKPLDQLRVRELTDLCAIRRQSFYYHFPDVFALFDWSLQQEETSLRDRQSACLIWQHNLLDLLNHTSQNRRYYQALLQRRGRDGLRQVLGLEAMVAQTEHYFRLRCGLPSEGPDPQTAQRRWGAVLMAVAESWVREAMPMEAEELVELLEEPLRQGAFGAALHNLPLQHF